MSIGADRLLSHALKQLLKRWIAMQAHAQRKRIDEEPDQTLNLGMRAICNWCSNDQIFLIAVARQQNGKSREQCHKGSCTCGLAKVLQLGEDRSIDRDRTCLPLEQLHSRARKVDRQLD